MDLFKALIPVVAAIITLLNVNLNNDMNTNINRGFVCNKILFFNLRDTVELKASDYKLDSNAAGYNLLIFSHKKLEILKKLKNVTIQFCLQKKIMIAKGNNIFRSDIPADAEYFFPVDDEGYIFITRQIEVVLRKTEKKGTKLYYLKSWPLALQLLLSLHLPRPYSHLHLNY